MVRRDVDHVRFFYHVMLAAAVIVSWMILAHYRTQWFNEFNEHVNTRLELAEARSTMNDMRVAHEGLTASLAKCKDALAAPPLPRTLGYVHTATPMFTAILAGEEKKDTDWPPVKIA